MYGEKEKWIQHICPEAYRKEIIWVRQEDNIKLDSKGRSVYWINMARDRHQCRAFVNMAIKFLVPQKAGKFD
jgi:dihydroxyacid dehydratase/phosphogluconate dehydratase